MGVGPEGARWPAEPNTHLEFRLAAIPLSGGLEADPKISLLLDIYARSSQV